MTCPLCKGTKIYTNKDGRSYPCPPCNVKGIFEEEPKQSKEEKSNDDA